MNKEKNKKDMIYDMVVDHLKDMKEVNIMVSGGVDSSTLLAIAKKAKIKIDNLFTVKLPYGPKHNEFDDMLDVVTHFNEKDNLTIIELNENEFDDVMLDAVPAIGRAIPHFNIFPLYVAFREMSKLGITDVIVGDGPDESMCGYTRHLIMHYLYNVHGVKGFEMYSKMIDKIVEPDQALMYSKLIGKDEEEVRDVWKEDNLLNNMCAVDMELMRPDMMDMSHGLAKHFGIKIHAPYEKVDVDQFMFNLKEEEKVKSYIGKYLLRELGEDLKVPKNIIWRSQKIGGPLVPVNLIKGWDDIEPFDKSKYIKYQENILEGLPNE